MINDFRFALRMLLKNPGFTAIALLTLAIGIGANSALFSLVNIVLLSPLPFQDSDRLVMIRETDLPNKIEQSAVSGPNFLDWQERSQCFTAMTAAQFDNKLNLSGRGEPMALRGALVTPSFFKVFPFSMALGRSFLPEDAEPGKDQCAVLSHGLWLRCFGGDTNIVGQTITLGGQPHTVIGVVPQTIGFIEEMIEVYKPIPTAQLKAGRGNHYLMVFGRLKPGITLPQAGAELRTIAAAMAQQNADQSTRSARLFPLHEQLVDGVRPALLVLYAAVVLVLGIACANVANLLLARGVRRGKEMAIRAAQGATRARIVRQLLIESVVLALGGAALGLLLARGSLELLLAFAPKLDGRSIPLFSEISLNGRVLVFTLGLALLTGLLFGLIPALHAAKVNLVESLKESVRGGSVALGHHYWLNTLVIAQIALSVVLLVSAGLLIRNQARLTGVNPGFNAAGLLTLATDLTPARYDSESRRLHFYQQVLEYVRALPGVTAADVVNYLPMNNNNSSWSFDIEGAAPLAPGRYRLAEYRVASPGYFRTMGIALRQGRYLLPSDEGKGQPVVVVNEALVRRYFPNENPLGRRIKCGGFTNGWEIVGVVGDVKDFGLNRETPPTFYQPYTQNCWHLMSFVVRTAGEPLALAKSVQQQIWRVDPDQPLVKIRAMVEWVRDSVSVARFSTLLLMGFALGGLLLAAIGVYGVQAYVVGQRTHEIGVRMALGASMGGILRLVLGQGLKLTLIGLAIGGAAAVGVARMLRVLLSQVSASDPLTFLLVLLILGGVAMLACWLPARRAMHIEPMRALRQE